MGTLIVPNLATFWESVVLAQQVEGSPESWDVKYVPILYYPPPPVAPINYYSPLWDISPCCLGYHSPHCRIGVRTERTHILGPCHGLRLCPQRLNAQTLLRRHQLYSGPYPLGGSL